MKDIVIQKRNGLWYPMVRTERSYKVMDGYFGYRSKEQLIKDVKHSLWFLGGNLMYSIVVTD